MIQLIANKYAQLSYQDVIVGIQLVNEPLASALTGGTNAVIQFYNDGYGNIRKISNTPVIIHDAFENGTFWDGVLAPPDIAGGQYLRAPYGLSANRSCAVVVDHHEYQVFRNDLLALSAEVSDSHT